MPFNFFPPSPLTGGHSKEDSTWNWGSNDTEFSLDQFIPDQNLNWPD